MSAITKPRSCHGNVICSAFSLDLDEQSHVGIVSDMEFGEGHESLQAFGALADDDFSCICSGGGVAGGVVHKTIYWQFFTMWYVKFYVLSLFVEQCVCYRIE